MLFRDGLEKKFFIHRKRKKTDFYMRQLMNLWKGMASAVAGGLLLCACSAEEDAPLAADGKGFVKIGLSADTAFGAATKAVDEENYVTRHPVSEYTVQILKDGTLVSGMEWKYSDIPDGLIELGNGTYQIVAFDGEEYNEDASTRSGIYMYGETDFKVESNQVAEQTVRCTPACGKLIVNFDEKMADYFNDYSIQFKTKAAGEGGSLGWTKKDTEPLYVKLEKGGETVTASFSITKKDGSPANVNALTKTMKWGNSWTINVSPNPTSSSGNLGITITIMEDDLEPIEVPIEIPSDWL